MKYYRRGFVNYLGHLSQSDPLFGCSKLQQVAIEIIQRLWLNKQQGQGKEVKKRAQDPVCGMKMDEKKAPVKSRHMEGQETKSSSCRHSMWDWADKIVGQGCR